MDEHPSIAIPFSGLITHIAGARWKATALTSQTEFPIHPPLIVQKGDILYLEEDQGSITLRVGRGETDA